MKIKIPKTVLYLLGVVILGVGLFRLGVRSTPGSPPLPPPPPPARTKTNKNLPRSQVREIAVTARQFAFSPNPIKVKLGDSVRLRLTSLDVSHGFSLPEFGINEILPPGQTVTVDFQATKRGTFPFACSVACGSGHAGMKGSLIVE